MLVILLLVSFMAGMLLATVIWKIAYQNGYDHGHYDGVFDEKNRLSSKYNLPRLG